MNCGCDILLTVEQEFGQSSADPEAKSEILQRITQQYMIAQELHIAWKIL